MPLAPPSGGRRLTVRKPWPTDQPYLHLLRTHRSPLLQIDQFFRPSVRNSQHRRPLLHGARLLSVPRTDEKAVGDRWAAAPQRGSKGSTNQEGDGHHGSPSQQTWTPCPREVEIAAPPRSSPNSIGRSLADFVV